MYMDPEVQKVVRLYSITHDKKKNFVKLQWLHVEGAFGILCLGHIIGFIVFCIEIFHFKFDEQKKHKIPKFKI